MRRGEAWEWAKAQAITQGAHALLLEHEHQDLLAAYESLMREDTPAKREILAIFRRWTPRFPEVSHVWEPFVVDELGQCRIREDAVVQAPGGAWCAVQIKSTAAPLATYMRRFWPRYVRRSSAFYRQGLLDLFGDTPFVQLLVVARLVPPYPWAIFSLAEHTETLDGIWTAELVPTLRDVTEALARGEQFGPEERGLFS